MTVPPPSSSVPRQTPAQRLNDWKRWGLDLIFPPGCTFCRVELESSAGGLLCMGCQQQFRGRSPACPRCAAATVGNCLVTADGCPHCHQQRLYFDAAMRLGAYEGALRTAVLQLKRPWGRPLAMSLGDLLADVCGSSLHAAQPDAVVPVPMHWSRKMWRGVNSAETLAECVARRLELPMAAHLLSRSKRTAPQARLSIPRRRANVRGAFRAGKHRDLAGARILLIDDIMTTGATLNEAARILRAAGAESISVAVLARAPGLA